MFLLFMLQKRHSLLSKKGVVAKDNRNEREKRKISKEEERKDVCHFHCFVLKNILKFYHENVQRIQIFIKRPFHRNEIKSALRTEEQINIQKRRR